MRLVSRPHLAAVGLTAAALAAGSAGLVRASTLPGADAAPLRILLTDDDGWDAPGIQAVFFALTAAGHDVVIVAPAENQSGSGARVGFTETLTLTQQAAGVFSVTGSPADATEVGMSVAFGGELPDLVVSGSNIGQNIAGVEVHSGTVGAAVTAINEGVPAIAVSTEGGEDDFGPTAAFTAELIAALQAAAGDGPLLPADIGLNVNFPVLDDGEALAGVAITTTDRSFIDIGYPDVVLPGIGASVEITPALSVIDPTDPDGDAAQLAAGFVSVTFISNNYDAAPPATFGDLGPLAELIAGLA